MKKIFIMLFCLTLLLPLYAQNNNGGTPAKNKPSFARQSFELGIDVGAGLDNDLIGINDILTKDIVIDLTKIGSDMGDSGLNINAAAIAGLYFNIKNVKIKQSIWEYGFFLGVDGDVKLNLPKSLFSIITEGNMNNHLIEGTITASGGIYAEAGVGISARFNKLRIGVKPALFSPLVFIPQTNSGINYSLSTTDEEIALSSSGEISIYSPFIQDGELKFGELKFGGDLSLDCEYALFSFLDIGGSISRIPIIPATVQNRLQLVLGEIDFNVSGQAMISGEGIGEFPEFDFSEKYDTFEMSVFRPMRFDLYVRLKPFSNEVLVIKPNVGFSFDINNKKGFFNVGAEAQLNLIDMLIINLSTDYTESIWTHKLGLVFNLRLFELNLQAALRSESFTGSLKAQGARVNVGLRFGW